MVTHAIYQNAERKNEHGRAIYHYPDEVEERDGGTYVKATGEAITVIPSAKMSKSKNNVVDPVEIIKQYGADTARWFVLSDSPPERDVEWTASVQRRRSNTLAACGVSRRNWKMRRRAAPVMMI